MKYIITIAIIFHQFTSGYWMLGWSVPESTALAIDSAGQCVKWTGESSQCTSSERFFMQYLYARDYKDETTTIIKD